MHDYEVSTILDYIDDGYMVLPVFQRGYVWKGEQVKSLFNSLYRRHPVGSLLIWVTKSNSANYRGDGPISDGSVKFILDGQQRITSLYGVIRGKEPNFFNGDSNAFSKLMFNLDSEVFSFYQKTTMKDNPLWVNLTELMRFGPGECIKKLNDNKKFSQNLALYFERLTNIYKIKETNLNADEVSYNDIGTVVEIFDKINSGGTRLSKGDLALAKICSEWPEARDEMNKKLKSWSNDGFEFNLVWLVRAVNAVVNGEAKFSHLESNSPSEIKEGLKLTSKYIDESLNLIGGRLGLDHNKVFFGRFCLPVMVRYLHMKKGILNDKERDKLLFWFAQAGMWGRYSGSTETNVDHDLDALKESSNSVDALLDSLRKFRGSLTVDPSNFSGSTKGARFYPVLYMLTRMVGAIDWGNGIPLRSNMHGAHGALETHHIFPISQLQKRGYSRQEIHSLGNFCFITKGTNLNISDKLPEDYFIEIEQRYPGALESHFIPMNEELWKIDNYIDFLKERRKILSNAANSIFRELLRGDLNGIMNGRAEISNVPSNEINIQSDESDLEELNSWVEKLGFSIGETDFDLADSKSGEQIAILDIAWPQGLQSGLTSKVAVLLGDSIDTFEAASSAGYRCFTDIKKFRDYVKHELLDDNN